MKAVTAAEMRRIEQDAIASGTTVEELMQRAGRAVADFVGVSLGNRVAGRRIVVLAGPGNNGGDGLIAARLLRQRGAAVSVFCPISRGDDDALLAECAAAGCGVVSDMETMLPETLSGADIVIDALLGTGHSRAISDSSLRALTITRNLQGKATVVAVDVPSGLDPDSGAADPATLSADVTVALGSVKIGCLTPAGADMCGQIHVAEIGLKEFIPDATGIGVLAVNEVATLLPERRQAGHKGTFGKVIIIGGSAEFRGAPALAARSALKAGAGTVALAAPAAITATLASMVPEATHIPLTDQVADQSLGSGSSPAQMLTGSPSASSQPEGSLDLPLSSADAVLIGPGLGQNSLAKKVVNHLLDATWDSVPAVLDADALNVLSTIPMWWRRLAIPAVLTPHPAEMARLCTMTTAAVQADRVLIADRCAKEWGVTIVLKGAYTVVASPDALPVFCPLAFPAMASGGMGDTLGGIITGLIAQGVSPSDAAKAGVYAHGAAAVLTAERNGTMRSGVLASDVIESVPVAIDLMWRGGPAPLPMFS